MKKITNKDIKKIEAGTELFDTISREFVKVTRVNYPFIEIGLLIEDVDSIKRNYKI